jgi:radical SAM superfamily enzyme YgiQ (UPF0313 family)
MKVFLGNAPWSKPGFYGVRAGSRWPHFENDGCPYMPFPFFLAYATALLKKNGITTRLVDAIAERISDDEFLTRVRDFAPDLVFYEISSASLTVDLKVIAATRAMLPSAKIVVAGPHFAISEPAFLDKHPGIDFALFGEYEFNLLALVNGLKSGGDIAKVPGLIFRDASGVAVKSAEVFMQKDLDAFPWPAREDLPMMNYWDNPGGIPTPSLQLLASRGCPFQCIFCTWPQLMYGGNTYRVRSPKDVVDEIEHCVKTYGFKSFYFDDDTFNVGKPRILALAKEIKDRGLNLPWAIMARADQMDREMLVALREAGLAGLKYGVESGSQDLLKSACKGLDLEKVKETVRITRELGIRYHLTFMIGLPGETWDTVKETIALMKELDPDSMQLSIATPFPGSRFHKLLEEKGFLVSRDLDDYDGYHQAVVRTEALSAEDLVKAHHMAEDEWRKHVEARRKAA